MTACILTQQTKGSKMEKEKIGGITNE